LKGKKKGKGKKEILCKKGMIIISNRGGKRGKFVKSKKISLFFL